MSSLSHELLTIWNCGQESWILTWHDMHTHTHKYTPYSEQSMRAPTIICVEIYLSREWIITFHPSTQLTCQQVSTAWPYSCLAHTQSQHKRKRITRAFNDNLFICIIAMCLSAGCSSATSQRWWLFDLQMSINYIWSLGYSFLLLSTATD